MYINYFHFNGFWFYSVDELAHKKVYRPYNYFDVNDNNRAKERYILLSNELLTHKEAKEKLLSLFPEPIYVLNKVILYHEAPRSNHCDGSRPKKSYNRKKNYLRDNKKDVY